MPAFGLQAPLVPSSSLVPSSTTVAPSSPSIVWQSSSSSSFGEAPPRIPQYILDHAPLVHLHSEEEYWPGDIAKHLEHTTVHVNFTQADDIWLHLNLSNLRDLNEFDGWAYLQSDEDPEQYPDWIGGQENIPDDAGRSKAPATLLVVDKGNDVVDAFWFFFYYFNRGNAVFRVPFGHHVGDWEHTAIRFEKGEPKLVFFSEHEWGNAYTWEAVEKKGKRLVAYSGSGSHAMYGAPGLQKYVMPFGLLYDNCDRGPLWDPALNMYAYTYDPTSDILTPSNLTPDAPTSWFHFDGRWGDKTYPLEDKRQYNFLGQKHYVDGPQGPKFKNLGRQAICLVGDFEHCTTRDKLEGT